MKSLAEFISEKREKAGMSVTGLAKRSGINIETIEDIESGKELFLSVTIRQKLARALKLQPAEIKSYEKTITDISVKPETVDDIKEMILEGETDLYCPVCGAKLVVRIAKMYDLEDNLVLHPKAHCSQCTFQIK